MLRGVRSLDEPLNVSAPLRFKVAPGSRFARVAAELAARGLVEEPRAWVLYARWKGLASAIKAGEYEIDPGTTPRSLLEKLVSGQVVLHSFTIVDGWRAQDMLAALRRDPDISVTLADPPQDLMDKLGAPGLDPEGQFLPETYRFPEGTPDLEILRQAHVGARARARVRLGGPRSDPAAEECRGAADRRLDRPEGERSAAGAAEDRGTVPAPPAHRHAAAGRPHADLWARRALRRAAAQRRSAYRWTVQHLHARGAPADPDRARRARAAIRATAHPENTDALYFVASPKDDGSHIFSATLEEQNAAVARYVAHLREKAAETAK